MVKDCLKVSLDAADAEVIREYCKKNELSISWVCRKLIRENLHLLKTGETK